MPEILKLPTSREMMISKHIPEKLLKAMGEEVCQSFREAKEDPPEQGDELQKAREARHIKLVHFNSYRTNHQHEASKRRCIYIYIHLLIKKPSLFLLPTLLVSRRTPCDRTCNTTLESFIENVKQVKITCVLPFLSTCQRISHGNKVVRRGEVMMIVTWGYLKEQRTLHVLRRRSISCDAKDPW